MLGISRVVCRFGHMFDPNFDMLVDAETATDVEAVCLSPSTAVGAYPQVCYAMP
jgi:hypothetical protein